MDYDNFYYDTDDDVINILDLIKYIISHWKSIILCALIFMLIGAGASMLKNNEADTEETVNETEELTEEDLAQLEADIESDYELLIAQYEDDLRLYGLKSDMFKEYSEAVKMLEAEIDRLKTIDDKDEDAKLQCLVKISSLQSVVNNANNMRGYYSKLQRPQKLQKFEDYREEMLEAEEKELQNTSRFSVKYALLGLIAGGFLGCLGWGLIYIFDGKLKTTADVERYGVNILGSPDKVGFVAANVKNFISEDVKSVLVTGTLADETLKHIAEAVKATVGVEDIRFASGLNYNADTAIMLSEVDAVVLAERLKSSTLNDLKEELAMVNNSGKILIGVAV